MQNGPALNRYLRTTPAAGYCGSTKSSFEKYRLTGGGPVFIKIGRIVVYDVADLDSWLRARRRLSTSDTGCLAPDDSTKMSVATA